ncbi:helix-turn-helix domain-containing protein [Xylanibacter muris]|uniref:helix-turn-helix domain-containing protein n=1 Tax=Xylanibacter muris TaxID=2736290 RepID=UPI0025A03C18|nr:helix-turn-helix domain-containing protein [Xylanibacter muris]
MTVNNKRKNTGAINLDQIIKNLEHQQKRVYNILARGGRHSVVDISIVLYLADPRSTIRDLRKKGIPILDEWHPNANGRGRGFKKFFLGKEVGNE